MKKKNIIAIVDCCDERFSKIMDYWMDEPIVGEKIWLELYPGQVWDVHVENILPKGHELNPYEFDVVFMKSEDENLFYCLCNCIGKEGWFEKEGACDSLLRR